MIHDKKELLNKLQILTKNGNESDIKMLLESMGVIFFELQYFIVFYYSSDLDLLENQDCFFWIFFLKKL